MQIYFAFYLRLAIIRLSTNNGDTIMSETIWDCIKAAGKDELKKIGKITRITHTKNGRLFLGLEVFTPVDIGNVFFVFMQPGVFPIAVVRKITDVINAEIEIEVLGELRSMHSSDQHVFTPLISDGSTHAFINFDCEVYRAHENAVVFG